MEKTIEKRKIQSKRRYILAFLIGTLLFLLVFGFTYSLSYFEYQRISGLNQELSYGIFKDKLYFSLFNKDLCSLSSFEKVSEDLRFQGDLINTFERKFGKSDKNVLFKKQFYGLVELEHFEFVNQINQRCNSTIQTILFFYSNNEDEIISSEEVGRLLDVVSAQNKNLIIYSFDLNIKDDLINELKLKYRIENSPTILINQKDKIFYPKNIDQIEQYLG
ncbi:MAG: hypothetical protein AABW67_02045 [Nanoarchaeota archaeon]